MTESFVLRANERGFIKIPSAGAASSYVSGHPDAILTRHSSLNFHEYQSGRAGFGRMRVLGDEIFSGQGCGYNLHPHHNFVICAFVLKGELTHINTVGKIDRLTPGDYYVFSAGSGGKHAELNLETDDLHVVYLWFLPDALYRKPSYVRAHFEADAGRNRISTLVGKAEGTLPIPQDVRVSRLMSNTTMEYDYPLASRRHGVYVFVLDGELDCGGFRLGRRDGAGVWNADLLTMRTGTTSADVLLIESIM